MSIRRARWIWFLGLWLLLPWPMWLLADGWAPGVRYTILTAAAASVMFVEGGSGVVQMVVVFFALHALATTLGCAGLAWCAASLLARAPARWVAPVTLGALAVGLIASLLLPLYRTPFGRAPVGGLLEILS